MLATEKHEAKISNVNLRAEKHGGERKLGVDISIKMHAGNEILDGMQKGLKESLYRKAAKGEQLDAFAAKDGLVAVRHPCLGALPINVEYSDYELDIDGMLEGTETIVLIDVKLKSFSIEAKEGGSVEIFFKVQARVDQEELGELADAYIRETVRITLKPPQAQSDDGAANDDAGEVPKAA
jgi:hypothetical protein